MKYNRLQRIVRGFSNHRRIEIIELLSNNGGISLKEICQLLKLNVKTASEHTRRLTSAGLIVKHYKGSEVHHTLTTRGKKIFNFLKKLDEQ